MDIYFSFKGYFRYMSHGVCVCLGIANLAWNSEHAGSLSYRRCDGMCRLIAGELRGYRIHASTISFMGSIRLANRPVFNASVGNRLKWEIRYMLPRDNSSVIISDHLHSLL